jgi:hypothetical protein
LLGGVVELENRKESGKGTTRDFTR